MKIVGPSVELLWITPEPEKQIEQSGRTCYKSEDRITEGSANEFCRKMVRSGHHAMLEHASASFRIVCDRGVSHEIVRHRIVSYAQESTRYCNYSKDKFDSVITVIEPPGLTGITYETWRLSCIDAEENYFILLDEGISPQIARSVLPTCLKTEIIMTANFREWRHFIKLRAAKAAHPQIRPIAADVWKVLNHHSSSAFVDLEKDINYGH